MLTHLSDAELDSICRPPMNVREALQWMDANWKRCVVRPNMDVQVYKWGCGPSEPGLYFLWRKINERQDELLYVGLSSDIAKRLLSHFKAGQIPFEFFGWVGVPREVLPYAEAAYIAALQPRFNNKDERTVWRGHEAMARRIRRSWAFAAVC